MAVSWRLTPAVDPPLYHRFVTIEYIP